MPAALTVIGGSLFIYSPGNWNFTMETKEFAALIKLTTGNFAWPSFNAPGAPFNPSGNYAGTLGMASADFGGKFYSQLWIAGDGTFTATPTTVPAAGPQWAENRTAFTFAGHLTAYTTNPIASSPPPLFSFPLTGKGNVVTRFTPTVGGPTRDVTSYFYSFT